MLGFWFLVASFLLATEFSSAKRPNFVVILTDDQDVLLDGLTPMPKTLSLLAGHGTTFDSMYVTTPLCCPSRSSLLTGMYAHNTGVVNNSVTGGCDGPAWQKDLEPKSLAAQMKALNYSTFYAGKYLNQYGKNITGGPGRVPVGWDQWNGLIGNSQYYNYSLSENGIEVRHGDKYATDYLTDVIRRKAVKYLNTKFADRTSTLDRDPFFMMLATPAPHAPFIPAPQYAGDFANARASRLPSFGVYGKDKHWLLRRARSPMVNESMTYINDTFRQRWRTLKSVDDLVESVVSTLRRHGVLSNTYVIFTSDNGFHLGQFSLPNDKRQLYEFDVRVPLIVRGPSISANRRVSQVALNIDLAPTIVDLAGGVVPDFVDGVSLKMTLTSDAKFGPDPPRDSFTIEHQGESGGGVPPDCAAERAAGGVANCFPDCVCEDAVNNTYVCVRTFNAEKNDVFCKFDDEESFVEHYDLKADPYQLVNTAPSLSVERRKGFWRSLDRLRKCRGEECRRAMYDNFAVVAV